MILNDMLQEFLFQKELAGLSKQSLKDYENILQIFVDYAGKELRLKQQYFFISASLQALIY